MKCIWILSLFLLNVALIDACRDWGYEPRGRMMDPVPGGWDQQQEQLGVVEMLANILSGKTPMEQFKENDADNNGCVDFNEILNWIALHKTSELAALANSDQLKDVEKDPPFVPMDPMFEKTMKKIVKQGVFGGEGMKAMFVEIVGKEDGCMTFNQLKQWAGL